MRSPKIQRIPIRRKVLYSFCCFVLFFVFAEVAVRIAKNEVFTLKDTRFSSEQLGGLVGVPRPPHIYDPLLGYVPTPNYNERLNQVGSIVQVSTDQFGFRGSGEDWGTIPIRILMVGDSFTFGAEVSNSETLPAQIEQLIQEPVVNAGVMGYGMDQILIRLEHILNNPNAPKPDTVILTIIPNDIDRCGLISREVSKPYFVIKNGNLKLKNVPVPNDVQDENIIKRITARSFLINAIMKRVALAWWMPGGYQRIHSQEVEVAKLLVERFHELSDKHDFTPYFLLLGTKDRADNLMGAKDVINKAAELNVATLDLTDEIAALLKEDTANSKRMFRHRHYSPEGNTWVAERVVQHWFPKNQVTSATLNTLD